MYALQIIDRPWPHSLRLSASRPGSAALGHGTRTSCPGPQHVKSRKAAANAARGACKRAEQQLGRDARSRYRRIPPCPMCIGHVWLSERLGQSTVSQRPEG